MNGSECKNVEIEAEFTVIHGNTVYLVLYICFSFSHCGLALSCFIQRAVAINVRQIFAIKIQEFH